MDVPHGRMQEKEDKHRQEQRHGRTAKQKIMRICFCDVQTAWICCAGAFVCACEYAADMSLSSHAHPYLAATPVTCPNKRLRVRQPIVHLEKIVKLSRVPHLKCGRFTLQQPSKG